MSGTKCKTRHDSGSKLKEYIGPDRAFNPTEVPTIRAVLQQGLLLRDHKLLVENVAKQYYSKVHLAMDLAPLILDQWTKSNHKFKSPITINKNSLRMRIMRIWQRAEEIAWGRMPQKVTDAFEKDLDKLLDLTVCPHTIMLCQEPGSGCLDKAKCKVGAHVSCSCPLPFKIPEEELVWLHSQRNKVGEKSKLMMVGKDVKYTKQKEKALKRKVTKQEAFIRKKKKKEKQDADFEDLQDSEESKEQDEEDDVEEFQSTPALLPLPLCSPANAPSASSPPSEEVQEARVLVDWVLQKRLGSLAPLVVRFLGRPKERRNMIAVLNTASASLRYNVSPAAAAAVCTGYLQDLIAAGHVSPDLAYLACDPSKLVRARKASMAISIRKDLEKVEQEEITGIYFDGRRDKTRALIPDSHGKMHPRIIKEEHIAVTVEPSGKYLTHFTPPPAVPPEKPAKKEAECLHEVLQSTGSTESCLVLGGDSTISNTGWKGGTLAHLEKLLGHKCQWVVCNIHTLELLLRHLIASLDGPTCSKDGFQGNVGKLLSVVEEMEYNPNFRALPGGEDLITIPDDIVQKMSTDAKLCYRLSQAVKTGILPPELQEIKPGPLCHARWLTTAERLVYMWTRHHGLTGKDAKVLEILVKFCLQMHFKMYFDIKVKHHLVDAPYHILTMLRILRSQPKSVRDIVTFYVRTGAWYAHHENVLVSLLASRDPKDRKFAVDQILKKRGKSELGDMSVRPRITPKLNILATTLTKMVNWKPGDVQESVFTCRLSKQEIKGFLETPFDPPKFTSHTQSTERAVKQVI